MCLLDCLATIDSSEALSLLTNNECREAVQSSSLTRSALRPEIDTPVGFSSRAQFSPGKRDRWTTLRQSGSRKILPNDGFRIPLAYDAVIYVDETTIPYVFVWEMNRDADWASE